MYKLLTLTVASMTLVGCGPPLDSDLTNIERGEKHYEEACLSCHSNPAGDFKEGALEEKSIFDIASLSVYIEEEMPLPVDCDNTCLDDLAAYLNSEITFPVDPDIGGEQKYSCDDPVSYGQRQVRVLTKAEYINSVHSLTGVDIAKDLGESARDSVPADTMVHSFSNNTEALITTSSLKAYALLASKIADESSSRSFDGIISCPDTDSPNCTAELIENWGFKVYRRPLSNDEIDAYYSLLDPALTSGDTEEGLKLIIQAMLTSPYFLYRYELGASIVDIENGDVENPEYEAVGNVVEVLASDLGVTNSEGFHVVSLYQNTGGSWYDFTGDDLLEVTVKGVSDGGYPTMVVSCDNGGTQVTGDEGLLINHANVKKYQWHIEGLTGKAYCQINNTNKLSHAEGRDLLVQGVTFSGAKLFLPPLPMHTLDRDAYVLDAYELAAYLGFTFTGTTPDDKLLEAARDHKLETDVHIKAQVARLLDTGAARKHFGDFIAQWYDTDRILKVQKDSEKFPGFTQGVKEAMAQEVREVYNHVVLDEREPFEALFNGNFTFANNELANFYGISNVSGDDLKKVTDLKERGGLLTAGAFLAVNAHKDKTAPIIRGVRIRRRALCHDVPTPPTGIDLDIERQASQVAFDELLAENNGEITSRDEYAFLTKSNVCAGCHVEMINPLGFGFEDFNAVGLPQIVEHNGLSVNASGELVGVGAVGDGEVITFNGGMDFSRKIAKLDTTRSCFVKNNFRLAMGTGPDVFNLFNKKDQVLSSDEKSSYACAMETLNNTMSKSNNSPRAMLEGIGALDVVRYRKEWSR